MKKEEELTSMSEADVPMQASYSNAVIVTTRQDRQPQKNIKQVFGKVSKTYLIFV
jgi:hypothetical protein